MKIRRAADGDGSQSMSAMTDVVFLLLIFFLVTMSGYVEMTLLEAGLPLSGGGQPELGDTLQVEIGGSDGPDFLSVNGGPLAPEEFLALMRRYARLQPDVEILIHCDPDSRHRDLVFVLSECALLGLTNLKMLHGG